MPVGKAFATPGTSSRKVTSLGLMPMGGAEHISSADLEGGCRPGKKGRETSAKLCCRANCEVTRKLIGGKNGSLSSRASHLGGGPRHLEKE